MSKLKWIGVIPPILIVVSLRVQKIFLNMQLRVNDELIKLRSKRLSLTEETINGIKVVKFNTLEKERINKIYQLRKKEAYQLFYYFFSFGFCEVLSTLNAPLTSLICFWAYNYFYTELKTSDIYYIIAMVGGLEIPVKFFTYGRRSLGLAKGYCKEFTKLLSVPKSLPQPDDQELERGELKIEDGSFSWENTQMKEIFDDKKEESQGAKQAVYNPEDPEEAIFSSDREGLEVLKNINFKAEPSKLIAVVGKVGSGKSSLLRAIVNEIVQTHGRVLKNGSIALIPQEAFMINDTIKNNILFGKEYDAERYSEVLRICQLMGDLDILPARDSTQIGERGINLSGGQKQRISIARAVYSDSDIYLIDDALSALDAHVGSKIMGEVFCGELENRTRVMVTHQLDLLKDCDSVVLMKHGRIVVSGSLQDVKKNADFKEFYMESRAKSRKESLSDEELASDLEQGEIDEEDLLDFFGVTEPQEPGKNNEEDLEPSQASQKPIKNKLQNQSTSLSTEASQEVDQTHDHEAADGQITKQESFSRGIVGFGTYLYFAKLLKPSKITLLVFLMCLIIGFGYFLDYFISVWMNNRLSLSNPGLYPFIYLGLVAIFCVILISRTYLFGNTFSSGGVILVKQMFHNILRRKMSFFDTTPIGQILARCGEDVNEVDITLPEELLYLLEPMFMVFGICMFVVVNSPLQIVLVVYILVKIRSSLIKFTTVSVELQRLLKLALAPMISTMSQMTKGVVSLRVYDRIEFLGGSARKRCDTYTSAMLHEGVFFHWIVLRVQSLILLLSVSTVWFVTLGTIFE